jgi:hypothetical protein
MLFYAAGCKGEREQAERAEAGRITHAIAALREAPNDAKAPRLLALERENCTTEELCELKRTCVEAYRLHARALEASRVAARALDGGADGEGVRRIGELVASSERDLDRARELTQRCSELESRIARRYEP